MITAKVYCFYNWKDNHMVFMFLKPVRLTDEQIEKLHDEARERMGNPRASMEVIVS